MLGFRQLSISYLCPESVQALAAAPRWKSEGQQSALQPVLSQQPARTTSSLWQVLILQSLRMTKVALGPPAGFGRTEPSIHLAVSSALSPSPSERLQALAPLTRQSCEGSVGWEIVVCVHRGCSSDALSCKPAPVLRAALAGGEEVAEQLLRAFPGLLRWSRHCCRAPAGPTASPFCQSAQRQLPKRASPRAG